jgi:predicted TIM-barrel fold metal-dependent hydrolase
MNLQFTPSREVEAIRKRIDHPIVDADGHLMEFFPLLLDLLKEEAGPGVVARFQRYLGGAIDPDRSDFVPARVFWALPERNTLDRLTVTLPELLYRRLDEIGVDFALLYPTFGLLVMTHPDDELRRAVARALNRYYADVFAGHRDRLEPVAIVPMFSPAEALEELDYAIRQRGLKTVVMGGVIPRKERPDGTKVAWLDTLGHESLYDYDPVWGRCLELGVAPAFHAVGYGWGTRVSTRNYVHNHLGNFASAQESTCRSLFMGGVPRRFPGLRFAFLEGGVAWGCQLLADILGHFEKRNREAVANYDPRQFDLELCRELLDRFASGPIAARRKAYEENAALLKRLPADHPMGYDDFAESGMRSSQDVVDVFQDQFSFGCEADDPLNALAFDRARLPHGARLNALFASDIGHWDVPDVRGVLPEAWELVERGQMSQADFREFAFANSVRMLRAAKPDFFDGTSVEDAARRV